MLTDLKDTIKRLEGEMHTLKLKRAAKGVEEEPQHVQLAAIMPAADGGGRVDDLKRQCDELAMQSERLQSEQAQLQYTLETYRQFVKVVCTLSTSSEDNDSDDDADSISFVTSEYDQPTSPWREPVAPETSDEDFSPDKRKTKFYNSPQPVQGVVQRTPLSTEFWEEIGYKHLTLTQARAFVNEAYQGILDFALSGRALSTGARVMGWEDKRLADGETIKFSLRKRFMGENANDLMLKTWLCFSDPECAEKKFRGLLTVRHFVFKFAMGLDSIASNMLVCVACGKSTNSSASCSM